VDRVRHGGEISNRLGGVFQGIEESARNVGRLFGEIATAINEQSQGVDQVNAAIAQIDRATRRNAENAERMKAGARDIEDESRRLLEANRNLEELVHGRSAAGGGKAPPRAGNGNGQRTPPPPK
jgi:methyl-accepting chemotaxis protein